MAVFKKIAAKGKYQDDQAIQDVVAYITRKDKTPNGIIGGIEIDINNIAASMINISESYKKNSHIRLHHFIVSFLPHEVPSLSILICIANEIATYIGQEYQVVYALHEDNYYPHLHFVFNAVSYIDGHRYRGGFHDYHTLIHVITQILRSYGIGELNVHQYIPKANNPHE